MPRLNERRPRGARIDGDLQQRAELRRLAQQFAQDRPDRRVPSSRRPAVAAVGSVRHAGSTIERHTANGSPRAVAIAPAICDSISTASAPVD